MVGVVRGMCESVPKICNQILYNLMLIGVLFISVTEVASILNVLVIIHNRKTSFLNK